MAFRRGFANLLETLLLNNRPCVIACGSRDQAYKDFCTYLKKPAPDTMAILLVDSEGPVNPGHSCWQHLLIRDQWVKPVGVTDDQCHLMVQFMESWFMAQPEILQEFYGQHFQSSALPRNQNIEAIPKDDILEKLDHATRQCPKGKYHKTRHGFAILALLDPNEIGARSQYAKRFFDFLYSHLN